MQKYKELYVRLMFGPALYSTCIGIDIGLTVNKRTPSKNPIELYSNVIGYTTLGILTGITYPISYPLFGSYIIYKWNYSPSPT